MNQVEVGTEEKGTGWLFTAALVLKRITSQAEE